MFSAVARSNITWQPALSTTRAISSSGSRIPSARGLPKTATWVNAWAMRTIMQEPSFPLVSNARHRCRAPLAFIIVRMLDDRSRRLLKTLIERYIADGQPVGSRALARISGLELSPATIRNVMADLEDMGFVSSPHTSAGRVPTPRGYRLFVDSLLTVQPIEQQQAQIIQGSLQVAEPQRALQTAAQMLSHLSHFAGVVLTPRRSSSFRQVEFL